MSARRIAKVDDANHPIKELLAKLDTMYGPLTERELKEGADWYDQVLQRLFSSEPGAHE